MSFTKPIRSGFPDKSPGNSLPDDIIKTGSLKKLKTNKKKYFVIRGSSSACLEYYNSEKKFKAGEVPKRCIVLASCLNISKKTDAKHKFVIALYTKDDCFQVGCDSGEEQEEWFGTLTQVMKDSLEESQQQGPQFAHIWEVTVKAKGLANGRALVHGQYRLCLTNTTLCLVRRNQEAPDLTFQLSFVRRCGNQDCFFFMEVGRHTVTGAGEIWMQVEDSVIAHNMHETVLNAMRSASEMKTKPNLEFRNRSPSDLSAVSRDGGRHQSSQYRDDHRGDAPRRHNTISGASPSLASFKTRHSTSERPFPPYLSASHSPYGASPLSRSMFEEERPRTNSNVSVDSRGSGSHGTGSSSVSADEIDQSPDMHGGHLTPEGPGSCPESNYLSMFSSAHNSNKDILVNDIVASSPLEEEDFEDFEDRRMAGEKLSIDDDKYMAMQPGEGAGYMEMTPGQQDMTGSCDPYHDMSLPSSAGISHSSSPAVSTCSSLQKEETSYFEMASSVPHSLPTVQEKLSEPGYLDMSPSSQNRGPPSAASSQLRPDKVCSFLSDDGSTDDYRTRAYSVGSKPYSQKLKPTTDAGYIDMAGRSLEMTGSKSCSAPHLEGRGSQTSLTGLKKDNKGDADLFMELDFVNKSDVDGMRLRTSSFGQEYIRRRTGSAGNKPASVNRAVSRAKASEGHRPRTSTIGQDSMRPRTSSFGPGEMRPRAASYSHANIRKRQTTSTDNSQNSSRESLRRVGVISINKLSQDSLHSPHSSIDHLERTGKSNSSSHIHHHQHRHTQKHTSYSKSPSAEGYMEMKSSKASSAAAKTQPSHQNKSKKEKSTDCQQHHHHHHQPSQLKMPTSDSNSSLSSSSSSHVSADRKTSTRSLPAEPERSGSPGEYVEVDFTRNVSSTSTDASSNKTINYGSSAGSVTGKQTPSSASHSDTEDSYALFTPGSTTVEKVSSPIMESSSPKSPRPISKPVPVPNASDRKQSNEETGYMNLDFTSKASKPTPKAPVIRSKRKDSPSSQNSPGKEMVKPVPLENENVVQPPQVQPAQVQPPQVQPAQAQCVSGSVQTTKTYSLGVMGPSFDPLGFTTSSTNPLLPSPVKSTSSHQESVSSSSPGKHSLPSPGTTGFSTSRVKPDSQEANRSYNSGQSISPTQKRDSTGIVFPSRGSSSSLPGMDTKVAHQEASKRMSLQEDTDAVSLRLSPNQPPSKELNYASLDLHSSSEDFSGAERPPCSPRAPKSPSKRYGSEDSGNSAMYAQIDFIKTDAIKRGEPIEEEIKPDEEWKPTPKETRPPFDL